MAKKILLVEHDHLTCQILQKHLAQHGYDVVLALDGGDEGILMAVTEAPDLILIATDLPIINGWQTIKILKASTVTQKIPILAMMVPTSHAEWSKLSESGCDDYELKPVDLYNISNKVKTLLNPSIEIDHPLNISSIPYQAFSSTPQQSQELLSTDNIAAIADHPDLPLSDGAMVVYIDDSPVDSQTMGEVVRKVGYGYDNITNPLDAIPLLLDLKPELIFLDLMMPFLNGYELCAQIRRTMGFKKTPIIIVTNNNSIIDRMRARFVGASAFLSKPLKEEQIRNVLKTYLTPDQNELVQDRLFVGSPKDVRIR